MVGRICERGRFEAGRGTRTRTHRAVTSHNGLLPKWFRDKNGALAKLKRPLVCLPVTLHPLTTARIVYAYVFITSPQSNLRRARCKGPIGYNRTPKFTPNAPSLPRSPPPSNTPIPRPTQLTTANGIRIQPAVLPQLTFADRQMGQANVLYH